MKTNFDVPVKLWCFLKSWRLEHLPFPLPLIKRITGYNSLPEVNLPISRVDSCLGRQNVWGEKLCSILFKYMIRNKNK